MGQQHSQPDKEGTRLLELRALISQAYDLQLRCDQAVYDAVVDYTARLRDERQAISARMMARLQGRSLPMPDPTPPLRLPPLPGADAATAPALSSAGSVEPDTPMGDASVDRRGGSSSSEECGNAGGAQRSDVVPLLGGGAGRVAPGLRRRQGHAEGT